MSTEVENQPFFVYGTLKPGQIAHYQIENEIDSARTIRAKVKDYYLAIRDGLPYAYSFSEKPPTNQAIGPLQGFLIYPKLGGAKILSETIADYEDCDLYVPKSDVEAITVSGEIVKVTIYVAKKARKRFIVERDDGEWRIDDDPILSKGLPRLIEQIENLNLGKMEKVDADMCDMYWEMMWKIQGAFANLNSVWEHFCRFYFGSGPKKNEYAKGTDELVKKDSSLARISVPFIEVHDAKTANVSRMVNTKTEPFNTWYQVRNNMVHSGKDGKRDLEILSDAIIGMATLLQAVIKLAISTRLVRNSESR